MMLTSFICCVPDREQAVTSDGRIKVSSRGSGGLDSGCDHACTGSRDLEATGVLLGTPSSKGSDFHAGAGAYVMGGAVADGGGMSCGSSSRHVGCAGGGGGSSGVADSGSGGCSGGDSGGGGGGCCSGGGGGGGE
jgi:loricrin